jgi:hypothetical protein
VDDTITVFASNIGAAAVAVLAILVCIGVVRDYGRKL